MKISPFILTGFLICMSQLAVQAQFTYTTNGSGTIVITEYTGPNAAVSIPVTINGRSVTEIGEDAFEGKSITSINIPNNITSIDEEAFDSCSLTSVTIPSSVTNIEWFAFVDSGLTSATIENSIISESEFNSTALTNVIIGPNVTAIGDSAFSEDLQLQSVLFQGNAPTNVGSYIFGYGDPGIGAPYDPATIYVYQGTTGWSSTFEGLPVVAIPPPSFIPVITAQPTNLVASALSPASFSVSVSGIPPLSYQWYENNTNLPNATASTYNIANVRPANLGTYYVIVTNQYGAATSSVANLNIYPYLATPFAGATAYWGGTNTISVGAWGTGLSYQWFDNGTAISGATNSSYTLSSVQFTNAGLYSVVVSNPDGSVTNTPEQLVVNAAQTSLGFFPNVTITGIVGYSYTIFATTDLSNTNSWVAMTNITLTQPVQTWVDTSTDEALPGNPQKFYLVQPAQ